MLNILFPKSIFQKYKIDLIDYVLPSELGDVIASQNENLITPKELRVQEIYTTELLEKIKSLGVENIEWSRKEILDIACGGGFLSYHLLKMVRPKKLTLMDISPSALSEAKKLLAETYPKMTISYIAADFLKSELPGKSFDVIIGNSFIHHFYNVPQALDVFYRLLKPGGLFISLHEPTPAAFAYESGKISLVFFWFIRGIMFIEDIRKWKGEFPISTNTGGDVWLFKIKDMKRLLINVGFSDIVIRPWHIFRPFAASLLNMHLSEKKNNLKKWKEFILKTAIKLDKLLGKFIPLGFFGSIAFCATKKNRK